MKLRLRSTARCALASWGARADSTRTCRTPGIGKHLISCGVPRPGRASTCQDVYALKLSDCAGKWRGHAMEAVIKQDWPRHRTRDVRDGPSNVTEIHGRTAMRSARWCTIAIIVTGLTLPAARSTAAPDQTPLDPSTLTRYLDPLPVPAKVDGTIPQTVTISEFAQQVLPSNFKAGPYGGKTLVW